MTAQQVTEVTNSSTETKLSGRSLFVTPIVAMSILFSCPHSTSIANPLAGGLLQSPTSSRASHLPGEVHSYSHNEKRLSHRQVVIRSIRGKYAHVATSSDAFAKRKQQEIERE
jgi:hypothetical protein